MRLRWCMALLLFWSVACVPARPINTTVKNRPLEVHTCVPDATVWLDGALVPDLRGPTDANGNITFLTFPSIVTAFNLHASAPNLPEYGAVITGVVPSTDRLIVVMGACTK